MSDNRAAGTYTAADGTDDNKTVSTITVLAAGTFDETGRKGRSTKCVTSKLRCNTCIWISLPTVATPDSAECDDAVFWHRMHVSASSRQAETVNFSCKDSTPLTEH